MVWCNCGCADVSDPSEAGQNKSTKEEMHAPNTRMAGLGASAEPSRRLSLPIDGSFCKWLIW